MKWTDDRGIEVRIMPTAEPHHMGCERGQIKSGESLLGNLCWRYYGGWWAWCLDAGDAGPTASVLHVSVWGGHGGARGFEIAKKNEAYTLHQEKYVGELLQRRQVQGRENHPLPKIVEDCEWKDPRIFKECQAIIGELQWLVIRTRPDLCYFYFVGCKDDSPTSCLCIGSV